MSWRVPAGVLAVLLCAWICEPAEAAEKPQARVNCEPSRACAWELAKQAGRDSAKARKDSYQLARSLNTVAWQQHQAGDRVAMRATVDELRRVHSGRGGHDADLTMLATLQAAAGLDQEALKTIGGIPGRQAQDSARRGVARQWAVQGRFKDALAQAGKVKDDVTRTFAISSVLDAAVASGREDWIRESARLTDPAFERLLWIRAAIHSRDFALARARTLDLQEADDRLALLSQIGNQIEKSDDWTELAETARQVGRHADSPASDTDKQIHYSLAIDWLIKAKAWQEALALIPKSRESDMPRQTAAVAIGLALQGDVAGAERMLPAVESSYRANVRGAILTSQVLTGALTLDGALAQMPKGDPHLVALERIGEGLPATREAEARAALNAWAQQCAAMRHDERDPSLAGVVQVQVSRGFFADALQTARSMSATDERLGAFTTIGVAQAKSGDLGAARTSFLEAGGEARKKDFDGKLHAQLAGKLGEAGLLQEAYAETVALARRPADDDWYDADVDDVLLAHVKAGQESRAYELAGLLSNHDRGNPHYYLVIASGVKTHP
jgi:hypothetical protein